MRGGEALDVTGLQTPIINHSQYSQSSEMMRVGVHQHPEDHMSFLPLRGLDIGIHYEPGDIYNLELFASESGEENRWFSPLLP